MDTVKFLVANRADLKAADNLGRVALDMAEEYQHNDVAEFLRACTEDEANPNSTLSQMRKDSRSVLSECNTMNGNTVYQYFTN